MGKEKKWFYAAIGLIGLTFCLVGLFNYIVDPLGFFREDFSWQFSEPNQNLIKARYIGKNPGKYDCFVFGSSRVNNIDVRNIKGYTCYNMTHNGGIPHEYLNNIRYMLARGVKMKLALIGLDEFSFTGDPTTRLDQPLRLSYPPVLHQWVGPCYVKYLFALHSPRVTSPAVKGFMAKIRGKDVRTVFYDMKNTGQMYSPVRDRFIDQHLEEHARNPRFRRQPDEAPEGDYLKSTMDELTQIIHLLETNRVKYIFFMNPPFKNRFLDVRLDELDRFKRKLVCLTDFWDFTGINSVTTNPYNYYESSHYRPLVGNMMLARMRVDKIVNSVPDDFGALVTQQNIEAHLQNIRRQVEAEMKGNAAATRH